MSWFGSIIDPVARLFGQKMQDDTNKQINDDNIAFQKEANEKNLALSRESFDYQKELNKLTMQREDTAMQRMVADLKAAGLSPALALSNGGAAAASFSSGDLGSVQAPHADRYSNLGAVIGSLPKFFLDAREQQARIDNIEANTSNINKQTEHISFNETMDNLKHSLDVATEKRLSGLSASEISLNNAKLVETLNNCDVLVAQCNSVLQNTELTVIQQRKAAEELLQMKTLFDEKLKGLKLGNSALEADLEDKLRTLKHDVDEKLYKNSGVLKKLHVDVKSVMSDFSTSGLAAADMIGIRKRMKEYDRGIKSRNDPRNDDPYGFYEKW